MREVAKQVAVGRRKMYKGKSISALIVAAGVGLRFGENKLLKKYDGIPVINYTLEVFCGAKIFDRIILAVNERLLTEFTQATKSFNPMIIIGGPTRTQSVQNGLSAVDTDFVVISDGARPFVTKNEITASLERAIKTGSGIAAIKSIDAVARARTGDSGSNDGDMGGGSGAVGRSNGGRSNGGSGAVGDKRGAGNGGIVGGKNGNDGGAGEIVEVLDKETLYNIQTPQSFDVAKIKKAYENIPKDASFADDSAVFINTFGAASLSAGAPENKKITTAADMIYFEATKTAGARGTRTSLQAVDAQGADETGGARAIDTQTGGVFKNRKICKVQKANLQPPDEQAVIPSAIKIGNAFDIHRLEYGRKLILGGVELPFEKGLLGHSDADCVIHAVMGGILNALGLKDIGNYFPDDDPRFKDAAGKVLLEKVLVLMHERDYTINNISLTIIAQAPKLSPYIDAIKTNLSRLTGCAAIDIGVSATTAEGLGDIGEGRAIACMCALTVKKA
jgi:2-C-methyl-D-erythritol 2,4-cyclodiphosphate synthase